MREITMEMTTMLVQVRHDRHPRLQLRRHGELGPGHLQGDLHPRGPRQLLPVQQAVGNDNDIGDYRPINYPILHVCLCIMAFPFGPQCQSQK